MYANYLHEQFVNNGDNISVNSRKPFFSFMIFFIIFLNSQIRESVSRLCEHTHCKRGAFSLEIHCGWFDGHFLQKRK